MAGKPKKMLVGTVCVWAVVAVGGGEGGRRGAARAVLNFALFLVSHFVSEIESFGD